MSIAKIRSATTIQSGWCSFVFCGADPCQAVPTQNQPLKTKNCLLPSSHHLHHTPSPPYTTFPPSSPVDFLCPIYSYSANCNLRPTTPSEAPRASSIEHPESAIRSPLHAKRCLSPSPLLNAFQSQYAHHLCCRPPSQAPRPQQILAAPTSGPLL